MYFKSSVSQAILEPQLIKRFFHFHPVIGIYFLVDSHTNIASGLVLSYIGIRSCWYACFVLEVFLSYACRTNTDTREYKSQSKSGAHAGLAQERTIPDAILPRRSTGE